jgi:hypothetical protein
MRSSSDITDADDLYASVRRERGELDDLEQSRGRYSRMSIDERQAVLDGVRSRLFRHKREARQLAALTVAAQSSTATPSTRTDTQSHAQRGDKTGKGKFKRSQGLQRRASIQSILQHIQRECEEAVQQCTALTERLAQESIYEGDATSDDAQDWNNIDAAEYGWREPRSRARHPRTRRHTTQRSTDQESLCCSIL